MKKHNTQYKTSTLTVTLLNKIEVIKRIVAVITEVAKQASVPFGLLTIVSSFIGTDFYHHALLNP